MRFGQLIEHDKIFFLKKHKQNVVAKLFLDPFLKIKIELIFGSTVWNQGGHKIAG